MKKLISLIILSLLLVIFTACAKNSKSASNSKGGNSTADVVQKGRVGNTNYNIANGGRIDEENGCYIIV